MNAGWLGMERTIDAAISLPAPPEKGKIMLLA
jgi:hypothetical protein